MSDVERFSKAWFVNQLKINSVALISLLTALSGFSYNAWRDHQNELNQNMRAAAFEVLRPLRPQPGARQPDRRLEERAHGA